MLNRRFTLLVCASLLPLLTAGCQLGQLAWSTLDQADRYSTRPLPAPDISAPEGYRVVSVVRGLNYPSAMTFDEYGTLYILESHTLPIPLLSPRVIKVSPIGSMSMLKVTGPEDLMGGAAIGLTYHEGWLYLSREQKDGRYSIQRVRPSGGEIEVVLRDLPTEGDHDVNHLLFDGEGALYFGIGSVTNSGLVSSKDPVNAKWLGQHPSVRELPCRDLVLTGQTFSEENDLTPIALDVTGTGSFQPYGKSATSVQAVSPCSGALYRLARGASTPELVAWGLRNPVGLARSSEGSIYIGMQGADMRSQRPIHNDPDAIYLLRRGAWYGWPDFSAALLPFTGDAYQIPGASARTQFVIDHARSGLSAPDRSLLVAATRPHAAIGGMATAPSGPWKGQLFVSEMGDFKPMTDQITPDDRAGFQIEIVEPRGGNRFTFLRNRGSGPPVPGSSLDLERGLERPLDVRFGPDGILYILDYGVFIPGKTPKVMPKTGKVFRLERVTGL